MKGYIFCSAPIENYDFVRELDFTGSLIICADNGYSHVKKLGLTPDVWIGDHDSSQEECPEGITCFLYPEDKDFTDTNLCIDYALEHGCKELVLIGGLGGRIDHEFSHFCLMKYALERGARLTMLDDKNEIWMADQGFVLCRNEKRYVSFFPYGGPVKGLCIRGLKYEVENFSLDCGRVQASSNEFVDGDRAVVDFRSGTLLVMRCAD